MDLNRPDTKVVAIIAYRRTGSNYFCGLLDRAFEDLHAGYEIFHSDKSYVYSEENPHKIRELTDWAEVQFESSERDGLLAQAVHEKPLEYVDTVARYCEHKVFAYKVFQNHLPRPTARALVHCFNRI